MIEEGDEKWKKVMTIKGGGGRRKGSGGGHEK